VASIELTNGNVVEIYDFDDRVLVSEVGRAYVAPMGPEATALANKNRLVDLFTTLRPDIPVPPALVQLQSRLSVDDSPIDTVRVQSVASQPMQVTTAGVASGAVTGAPAAAASSMNGKDSAGGGYGVQSDNACSNGCCDDTWLKNNICSGLSGYNYSWYLFDYGWSYENSGSISDFYGAACAGIGTSLYTVSIQDGSGGSWSVPEGTYRTFGWHKCLFGCFNDWEHSTVNSQADQHLHTYCGGVLD
jgi:hypothetical protein